MRIFLFLFITIFLYAKTLTAEYEAKYGWFGTIASAKGVYENNGTNYKIEAQTKAEGIVKSLSKNLKQTYISTGIVKNGILIPKKYIQIIKKDNYQSKRIYTFDHKNKKIHLIRIRKGKIDLNKTLPYYAQNDILSLYFNLPKLLKKRKQTFYAVGGNKQNGKIDVEILNKTKKNITLKANLYNKVFAGDKGELLLKINKKNWITEYGKVKNVLKIGDLEGWKK